MKKIDAVVAKILPSVHNHRKYLALVLLPGLVSLVLPWRVAAESRSVFGVQGPGWLVFLLTAFATWFVLAGPRPKSLRKPEKITVLAAAGLALAISLLQLFVWPEWAKGIGIGLPLAMLSMIGAVLVGAFCKAEPGAVAETAYGVVGRALHDMSGKRGKEKLAAMERRDELLRQLGEAALETGKAPGPDADAAAKAKSGLEETRKMITGPQAKQAIKAAEGKLKRALQKLGRSVADENLPLDGRQLPTAEILELDAKIKELG